MKQVRWSVVAAIVMAAALTVGAEVTETVEMTQAVTAGARLSLENINGDVVIETWSANEVWVKAEKTASNQERLDALKIVFNASETRVRIETEYPRSNRGHDHSGPTNVKYWVKVPATIRIDSIDLINGDLEVSGVHGGLNADTVNGGITATDVSGDIDLETVNGYLDVRPARLSADDSISLDAVNGTIELVLTSPASVEVETINGRISNDFGLEVVKGKYVGASMSGDIQGGGAQIEIETVNGRVKISGS